MNLFNITFGDLIVDNSLSRNDTYSYVNLDLSKLHELKKLKELNLSWILASDIKAIKALPNLKKLNINIMHHTKEDHLSSYDAEPEVNDKDLLFFKESKKLEDTKLIKSSAVLADAIVLLIGINFERVPTDSRTVLNSCSENLYSNPRSIGISILLN